MRWERMAVTEFNVADGVTVDVVDVDVVGVVSVVGSRKRRTKERPQIQRFKPP